MNAEQIDKWAREADMDSAADGLYIGTTSDLTRFAELVVAHERERCAKVVEDFGSADPEVADMLDAIRNTASRSGG